MERLSQDEWDVIFHYLLPNHLARLWVTGDTRVQSRLQMSRGRCIRVKTNTASTLCSQVLVNRAREIKTAFASVLFGPRAIASDPIARKNLTVLEYNGGQGRYHHIPNSPPLYDFGLLQRLQVCHLRHAPFVKEIILPKSVTELTLPISCRANYGELTSLVKLKLMVMDGGTPYSLNQPPQPKNVAPTFTWPPSLSSLEIDTSPHAYPNDDFTKLFPPTLTHLGYTGEASALIDMVRAIPPQCTALESIHFENAHFERRDYNVGLLFPSSLHKSPPHNKSSNLAAKGWSVSESS